MDDDPDAGERLEAIGSGSFADPAICGVIQSITIPETVTAIEADAFSGCTNPNFRVYCPTEAIRQLVIDSGVASEKVLLTVGDRYVSLAAPVSGEAPQTTIETAQYTGSVSWVPAAAGAFAPNTEYGASISLSPKPGYALGGVRADFFRVLGATVTYPNRSNGGSFAVQFPATDSVDPVDPVEPPVDPVDPVDPVEPPIEPAPPANSVRPGGYRYGSRSSDSKPTPIPPGGMQVVGKPKSSPLTADEIDNLVADAIANRKARVIIDLKGASGFEARASALNRAANSKKPIVVRDGSAEAVFSPESWKDKETVVVSRKTENEKLTLSVK
ncbi:MAG: leucine-rich repeat domain-containing protein [Clostridiales bacterium]|nr:leucine-rich repeat domain-containing protein [Clostridiales bacterium]